MPVFLHSITRLRGVCPDNHIVFVGSDEFLSKYQSLTDKIIPGNQILFTRGGETRSDSVINGLSAISKDIEFVAIHDAARPLVTIELLKKCIEACSIHGSGVAANRISDTVKQTDSECFVTKTIDRTNLWAIQTPQVFRLKDIKLAYDKIKKDEISVTDDASAMEHLGYKVYLVENPEPNLKITYSNDLKLAESLLLLRTRYR